MISGCSGLPNRSFCTVGGGGYNWLTRSPKADVVISNVWCEKGARCPAMSGYVLKQENGTTEYGCRVSP